MLERVIYVSRARADITRRDAYDIIRSAHNRNSRLGLSGLLLLLDGHFMQVLEGESTHLEGRLQVIRADARHHQVDIRERVAITQAAFAGEWMALCLPDNVPADVRARFGYRPGFPAEQFDAASLLAFAMAVHAPASR